MRCIVAGRALLRVKESITDYASFPLLRLPLFQTLVDNLVAGIPVVAAYLDDIIVTGRSIEDHLSNLRRVPSALHDYRLKLQLNLFAFFEEGRYLPGLRHFKIWLANRQDMAHAFLSSQTD